MNRIEGFITPHINDLINDCDDNFSVNFSKNNFAIADGSSSDFFSKIYARMLSDRYVEQPDFLSCEDNIKELNSEWRSSVINELEKAGCKPGSFPYVRFQKLAPGCSTLIGLSFFKEENQIKFSCKGLGDSVLFFVPKGKDIPTFQFSSDSNDNYSLDQSVVFGYTPVIAGSYSTNWLKNIKEYNGTLTEGVFYLMTDGMAEWILRQDKVNLADKFKEIECIHSQEAFIDYVNNIRKNGAHNDDMTLLKIYVDNISLDFSESDSIIYDYRKDQIDIEKEAFELRKKKEEEKTEKPVSCSRDNLSWINSAILAKKKKEENKKETKQRLSSLEDTIQAAKAKIKDDNNKSENKAVKNNGTNNQPLSVSQSSVQNLNSSRTTGTPVTVASNGYDTDNMRGINQQSNNDVKKANATNDQLSVQQSNQNKATIDTPHISVNPKSKNVIDSPNNNLENRKEMQELKDKIVLNVNNNEDIVSENSLDDSIQNQNNSKHTNIVTEHVTNNTNIVNEVKQVTNLGDSQDTTNNNSQESIEDEQQNSTESSNTDKEENTINNKIVSKKKLLSDIVSLPNLFFKRHYKELVLLLLFIINLLFFLLNLTSNAGAKDSSENAGNNLIKQHQKDSLYIERLSIELKNSKDTIADLSKEIFVYKMRQDSLKKISKKTYKQIMKIK